MTAQTCRHCGQPIQWLPTKSGKMAPHDLRPVLHVRTCKKRPKADSSPPVEALVELGYQVTESRQAVKGLLGTDEEKVKKALQRLTKGR